ncbi:MAG: cbb3-type cytochrome c oxidase N-terminal domain-containing protein [Bdellovibrionota bacterium]
MSDLDEKILDHDYDGIKEFDNPLPRWWLATFYGAILFSIFYVAYYHFGPGPAPETILSQDIEEMKSLERNSQKADPGPTEEALAAIYHEPSRREEGKRVFTEKCAVCHGVQGGGLIGPNLTDNYWIHGKGTLVDIFHVVSEGILEKGMPSWKLMLKKDEVQSVVVYVKSLRGSHPANPKAPQGEEVKD